MERMNLFQDNNKPQITFYFAECMEFPDYGEYKEFPSLAQAISLFEKCPGSIVIGRRNQNEHNEPNEHNELI